MGGGCGGALRPITWRAVHHVEISSQVISPGAWATDEGPEQLWRPICLSPSPSKYGVFKGSSEGKRRGVRQWPVAEMKAGDWGCSPASATARRVTLP